MTSDEFSACMVLDRSVIRLTDEISLLRVLFLKIHIEFETLRITFLRVSQSSRLISESASVSLSQSRVKMHDLLARSRSDVYFSFVTVTFASEDINDWENLFVSLRSFSSVMSDSIIRTSFGVLDCGLGDVVDIMIE